MTQPTENGFESAMRTAASTLITKSQMCGQSNSKTSIPMMIVESNDQAYEDREFLVKVGFIKKHAFGSLKPDIERLANVDVLTRRVKELEKTYSDLDFTDQQRVIDVLERYFTLPGGRAIYRDLMTHCFYINTEAHLSPPSASMDTGGIPPLAEIDSNTSTVELSNAPVSPPLNFTEDGTFTAPKDAPIVPTPASATPADPRRIPGLGAALANNPLFQKKGELAN